MTPNDVPDVIRTVQNLAIHSRQYLENGLMALRDAEAGKAGELLWGSVALAVQAVATSKGHRVDTHRKLKNFTLQLAIDLNYVTIRQDFIVAESLHHNFYEVEQEPQDIVQVVPNVEQLLVRLFGLIPPEILAQRTTP